MKHFQKSSSQRIKTPPYRPAFAWLDAALAQKDPYDHREKIRLLREAHFADVAEYLKTNPIILPKP